MLLFRAEGVATGLFTVSHKVKLCLCVFKSTYFLKGSIKSRLLKIRALILMLKGRPWCLSGQAVEKFLELSPLRILRTDSLRLYSATDSLAP